jgi:putative ABC transport system permease protein
VIMVDEKLAHRFWPDQDAVGRRMYRPNDLNNLTAITDKTVFFTVVGIVHDIKLANLVQGNGEVGAYYFPLSQDYARSVTFTLRTTTDPVALSNSVRGVISALDRELPVFDTQTMEERTERSLMSRRSPLVLSLSFGGVALFLSALGIYGVLAYVVTQRTREIGIRIALGSSAREIFELVVREGVALVGAGFLLGAAGAFALRKSLESQLFATSATDPIVLVAAASILASVALIACVLPARRATRIDPVVALTA